jgi:hypothetical protein
MTVEKGKSIKDLMDEDEDFKKYMEAFAKVMVNITITQPRPLYDIIKAMEKAKKKREQQ